MIRILLLSVLLCLLGACAAPPVRPPVENSSLSVSQDTKIPDGKARLVVRMGNMRGLSGESKYQYWAGDIEVNGQIVGHVTKNPEVIVVDLQPGFQNVLWRPASDLDKSKTNCISSSIEFKPGEVRYAKLDFIDKTNPVGYLFGALGAVIAASFETNVTLVEDQTGFVDLPIVSYQKM